MNELIITITEASEGGYMYDIYDDADKIEDGDTIDGGHCTTTLSNALDMAHAQAQELLKAKAPSKI